MPKAKNQSNFRGVIQSSEHSEQSRISIKGQFSVSRIVGGIPFFASFFLKKKILEGGFYFGSFSKRT